MKKFPIRITKKMKGIKRNHAFKKIFAIFINERL